MLSNDSISILSRNIVINENTKIELDLAGYTVKGYINGYMIENSGDLKITSSVEGGSLTTVYGKNIKNIGESSLEIENVQIIGNEYSILHNSKGNLTINSGKVTANKYAIFNNNSGYIEINDGEIQGGNGVIYNNNENGIISTCSKNSMPSSGISGGTP